MKKVFLVLKEGVVLESELLGQIRNSFCLVEDIRQAEIVLAIGGDGTMLHAIQKYRQFGLPFVGLHKGGPTSVGFIMDEISQRVMEELSGSKIRFIESKLLLAGLTAETKVKVVYAFNDLNFERISTQALKINVSVGGEKYFEPIQCDGIMVASAIGSTAYNANAGGAILHPDSRDFVLTAVAPQKSFGWNTLVLPENETVLLELAEADKRPARFVADGVSQGDNFIQAEICLSIKAVKIGFAAGTDFRKKVRNLQFRGRVDR